jgi:hypothetical protein
MNHRKIGLAASLLAALALPVTAAAQLPVTPRALGMGDAFIAAARGHESLFLNPANLTLPGTPVWSIAFPQISVAQSGRGLESADVRDMLLDYDRIDEARRQEILAAIPAEGTSIDLQMVLPGVSVQAGSLVFGLSKGFAVDHSLGRDVVELFFEGYESGRTNYTVGNTTGSWTEWWDLAAGYGRRIGPVHVGATGHFYLGTTRSRSRMFDPNFAALMAGNIEIDYYGAVSRGGRGFGLDVGAAMQPVHGLTLSASVANVVSQMTWDDQLYMRKITLTNQDFANLDFNEVLTQFEQSERAVEPSASDPRFQEVARGLFDTAHFPAVLRAGASYVLPTRTTLAAAYRGNVTGGELGAWWDTSLGVGVEQDLRLLKLRGGYAVGSDGGNMLTGGLSLGPVEVGVARLLRSEAGGVREPGIVASFGVNVRTPRNRF